MSEGPDHGKSKGQKDSGRQSRLPIVHGPPAGAVLPANLLTRIASSPTTLFLPRPQGGAAPELDVREAVGRRKRRLCGLLQRLGTGASVCG